MFNEIRSKRGLAYDVGTQNIGEVSFGYFALYSTINKKDLPLVKKLMLKEIEKLKNITKKELSESKTFIEGNYLLSLDDPQKMADQLLYWNQVNETKELKQFISKVKKVTIKDVQRAIFKYFNYYTVAIVEGK
jgi:predicted Zn-dependent peptidase